MTLEYIGIGIIGGFIHYTIFINLYYLFYFQTQACTMYLRNRFGYTWEKAERKRKARLAVLRRKISTLFLCMPFGYFWILMMTLEEPSLHNRMQWLAVISAVSIACPVHILILNTTYKYKVGKWQQLEWIAVLFAGILVCVFLRRVP